MYLLTDKEMKEQAKVDCKCNIYLKLITFHFEKVI